MASDGSSWLALEATFGPPFDGPWGLTLLPDGSLCVVERGSNKAPPRLCVVADPTSANPNEAFANRTLPLPDGDVDDIQGAWCDGSQLLVADLGNHCVHRLSLPDGKQLQPSIGLSADADAALHCPRAVCVLDDAASPGAVAVGPKLPSRLICVADAGNGRVQIYDAASLAPVRSLGKAAEPGGELWVSGELEQPLGVVAHAGEVYVLDGYQHRCTVFCARTGRVVRSIGGPELLTSPFGILVVRGMVVISEATRLQIFTLEGVHRYTLELNDAENLSGLCAGAGDEHVYVADYSRGCVHRLRVGWADEGDRLARHGLSLDDIDE